MKRVVVILCQIFLMMLLIGILGYLSPHILALLTLMVLSITVGGLAQQRADDIGFTSILHRCCATSHCVFISFYFFQAGILHASMGLYYWMAGIGISFTLYAFSSALTSKILETGRPDIFRTDYEKWNVLICVLSLVAILVVSNVLV